MTTSSAQRRGLSGSLFTFLTVAAAAFALLSLIGALMAPSASADDDEGSVIEPTQDPFNLSEWESCGDSCIVPELICPPGFAGPVDGTCEITGKALNPIGPISPDANVIDCPDGQYAAYDVPLTEENLEGDAPPIEFQFCSEPTAELLLGAGISCPDGYSLPAGIFPPVDLPEDPTEEELAEIIPILEAAEVPPMEDGLPQCTAADGTTTTASIYGFFPPAPYDGVCEGDARLVFTTTGDTVCRADDGSDVAPTIVPLQPLDCGPDAVEVGTPPFNYCEQNVIEAFPVCPVGYIPFAASPDAEVQCTNDPDIIDQVVAIPPFPEECGPECEADILEAIAEAEAAAEAAAAEEAADEDYVSYPAQPACPDFAILADGSCANIITGSGQTGGQAPVVVQPPAVVQPVPGVIQPAPVVVIPIAPAPPSKAVYPSPIASHIASNYGFGDTLPMTTHAADDKAKTAATLAHTGAETNTLLYAALSMIAAGAVAMGSRRRETVR